jgi:sialidase-1
MAGFLRVEDAGQVKLLFSNPDPITLLGNDPAHRPQDRVNVTFRLSDDEGRTWHGSRRLETGVGGYSDLAQLPNGEILCLSERGPNLVVSKFPLRWLIGK